MKTKPVKSYMVTIKTVGFSHIEIKATSKAEAREMAWARWDGGSDYGESDISSVTLQPEGQQ